MRAARFIGAALFVFQLSAAHAQAVDQAQIDAGMAIYKAQECDFCHGWAGAGGQAHDDHHGRAIDPGPPLVAVKHDRAALVEIVSCGVPGRTMPQYLADAWSETRKCYGKVAADLPAEMRPVRPAPAAMPPDPVRPLTASQIDAVVAFIQAVYQVNKVTLEFCQKYNGVNSQACAALR